MQTQELIDLLDIPFSFHEQSAPLQPQLRVIWGLSILVLILHICSRGKRSSIPRLHLINWSIRNRENRDKLINFLETDSFPLGVLIRFEPGFSRAIEYAIADSIVEPVGSRENLRIHLLQKGTQMATEIIEIDDI